MISNTISFGFLKVLLVWAEEFSPFYHSFLVLLVIIAVQYPPKTLIQLSSPRG